MALLTETEAAVALGMPERRLRIMRRLGGGPTHVHLDPDTIRYDTHDLATWCRYCQRQ